MEFLQSPHPMRSAEEIHQGEKTVLEQHSSEKQQRCTLFFPAVKWSARYGKSFFTVTIDSVVVPDGLRYAVYSLVVRYGEMTHTVCRRYSEFYALRRRIQASKLVDSSMATFPAKTWFSCTEAGFLEERRCALQLYFERVLSRKGVCALSAVRSFLQLDPSTVVVSTAI